MAIYHITQRSAWQQALSDGVYRAASLAQEGFIHASTLQQVIGTANLLFHGQAELVLLEINVARLLPEVRYEQAPGSTQSFPHIYGPLNIDAVTRVIAFPAGTAGSFDLPSDV